MLLWQTKTEFQRFGREPFKIDNLYRDSALQIADGDFRHQCVLDHGGMSILYPLLTDALLGVCDMRKHVPPGLSLLIELFQKRIDNFGPWHLATGRSRAA